GVSSTANGFVHAFLYENGVMTDLGTLPGRSNSSAFGINNRGQIVGESDIGNNSYSPHAFLFEHGMMTDLGTLPGDNFSEAVGITERGQIAGNSTSSAILWTREK
ncbi:MAG TPA: HAF repeat-containing protein, partial [Caballeronia sp.]|nr:HAF repeat-containing protein [Caballeronia sp.]